MPRIASILLIVGLISAESAFAETRTAKEPEQMIREGAERILEGVRGIIERIPQYLPPEILPNGDIIIRKLPRGSNRSWPQSEPEPGPDGSLRT